MSDEPKLPAEPTVDEITVTSLPWLKRHGFEPLLEEELSEGKNAAEIAAAVYEHTNIRVSEKVVEQYIRQVKGDTRGILRKLRHRRMSKLEVTAAIQQRVFAEMLEQAILEPETVTVNTKYGEVEVPNQQKWKKIEMLSRRQLEWFAEQRKFFSELDEKATNITNNIFNPVAVISESLREGKMPPEQIEALITKLRDAEEGAAKFLEGQPPGGVV